MQVEVRNERTTPVWLQNDSSGTGLGEVQPGSSPQFQVQTKDVLVARSAAGDIVNVYEATPRVPAWVIGPTFGGLPVPLRAYDAGSFNESLRTTGFLSSTKVLTAAMLFVDFDDAQAAGRSRVDQETILQQIVGEGPKWLRQESFGAADLAVTPVFGWKRMPKKAADYSDPLCICVPDASAGYLADAMGLYGWGTDFSSFDLVFVVAAKTPLLSLSPAFVAVPPKAPVNVGNGEVRFAVTFGEDSYSADEFLMIHELCHLFGLPDLYDGASAPRGHPSSAHVDPWDLMANQNIGRHLLAWHRLKLGWLQDSQVVCHFGGGELEIDLAGWSNEDGVKAVMVPVQPSGSADRSSLAYVVETALPPTPGSPSGVLVYSVNAAVPTWERPLHVRGGVDGVTPQPFAVSETFHHLSAGLSVKVLTQQGDGFRVRIGAS